MRKLLWSATVLCLFFGPGCDTGRLPEQPSPPPPTPTAPAPFVPKPGANGTFTWISINSPRPLCKELTSQVGQSWSIWFLMEIQGDVVTLTLSESPLPPGPFDDPPARWRGTRDGSAIAASRIGPMGGMACPGDGGITPQVGGTLTGTVSVSEISGEFTDIFGTGPAQVTFGFRFHATLPE